MGIVAVFPVVFHLFVMERVVRTEFSEYHAPLVEHNSVDNAVMHDESDS